VEHHARGAGGLERQRGVFGFIFFQVEKMFNSGGASGMSSRFQD
jgi:hypothetical protein